VVISQGEIWWAKPLPKDSVANVSQIVTVNKLFLTGRVGKLPPPKLDLVLSGVGVILGK
jgi:mRNA interferase MazF